MGSREDRAVLDGFGEMLLGLVSKHATGRQWQEWLKAPLELALRLGDGDLVSRLLVAGSVAREGSGSHGKTKNDHALLLVALAERTQDKINNNNVGKSLRTLPGGSRRGAAPSSASSSAFISSQGVPPEDQQAAMLQEAVQHGDPSALADLFTTGAKAGSRQELSSLLHSAVKRGDPDIVSELLSRGAAVDMPDLDGRSPLRAAVSGCSLPVVTLLLERGAGASTTLLGGRNGMLALVKTAVRKDDPEILKALAANGADVDDLDSEKYTALHHAAMLGKSAAINGLIEAGADVSATNPDNGCTALHFAARNGHCEAMVALLRHGADVDAEDNGGRTPLHRACSMDGAHTTEAAEVLLIWGADDGAANNNGHIAEDYVRKRVKADDGNSKHRGLLAGLLRMLASSPADRAWCRRGLVVLCKARLGEEGICTFLDRLMTLEEEEQFDSSWNSKKESRAKHKNKSKAKRSKRIEG